jgi:predicted Zn finger-like uncharacterized protein
MKFLCDRCKTRYSIADERVRGKILKIRCKNCSNIVTVREGMPAPAAESPVAAAERRVLRPTDHAPSVVGSGGAPALQQAFAQAMRPSAPPPAPPPPQLEAEWYVSVDGDQQGPLTLSAAQQWVRGRRPAEELFCWCEGFDDWLPVDKVSHFRGLRAARGPSKPAPRPGPPPPPAAEEEPRPLFAAALAALEAEVGGGDPPAAPALAPRDLPGPAAAAEPAEPDEPDDDLAIGEVSRVVRLQDMAAGAARRPSSRTPTARPTSSLAAPIVEAASASLRDERPTPGSAGPGEPVLAPVTARSRRPALPILAALAVLVLAATGIVVLLLTTGGQAAEDAGSFTSTGRDVEGLAISVEDPRYPRGRGGEPVAEAPVEEAAKPKPGGATAARKPASAAGGPGGAVTSRPDPGGGKAEAVLGPDGQAVTPLTPDDVISVASRMASGTQRCYQRALKEDPFLQVRSLGALISIGRDGKVSAVTLDSLQTSSLGQCLVAAIKRWPFRRSTEGLHTKITLKFEQVLP